MPILSRRTNPLLRIVGGETHASSDDHDDDDSLAGKENQKPCQLHTKPLPYSEQRSRYGPKIANVQGPKRARAETIDLEATPVQQKKARKADKTEAEKTLPSPDSTNSRIRSRKDEVIMLDDDEDVGASPKSDSAYDEELTLPAKLGKDTTSGFKSIDTSTILNGGAKKEEVQKPKFQSMPKPNLGGEKRKMVGDDELDSDSDGLPWGNSKPSSQTRKKKPARTAESIVFAPRSSQQSRKRAAYGKEAVKQQERNEKAQRLEEAAKRKEQESQKKKFKAPVGLDFGAFGSSQAMASFKTSFTSVPAEVEVDTSPLSELSEDELEELDLTGVVPSTKCTYCGDAVPTSLQEDFADEVLKGRALTYKWKQRFCTWHKKKTAEAQWQEKGYPMIDWRTMPQRLQAHDAFLKDVIDDKVDSYYRSRLKAKSKKGVKNLHESITSREQSKGGASMGYYGPKGEKMITEHIIGCLSDDIRTRSTKDRLVSTSGLQGGISGFVQVVLAPHLVELLVKEDMKLSGDDWEIKAREIVAESAAVGELLNPEEDKMSSDDDDGDRHVVELVDSDDD